MDMKMVDSRRTMVRRLSSRSPISRVAAVASAEV